MPEKLEVVLTPKEIKLSSQRSNLLVNILFLYNKQGDITPTVILKIIVNKGHKSTSPSSWHTSYINKMSK